VLPRSEWTAFIPGAHPGYITLEQYDANLARLTANAHAHGGDRVAGPPREGPALLQGVILCGRCGQRMTVRYHHTTAGLIPSYLCQRVGIATATSICTVLPGHTLDARIGVLLIQELSPLSIEAAFTVTAELAHRAEQADALRAAHVERARYHAENARRRYLAVDPANRLVADTLEADWNTALRALRDAQLAYDKARQTDAGLLTDAQKRRIQQLADDLPAIWNDPATPARERKRIARLLLSDVTVTRTRDTITAHVRLTGGQHHTLALPVPKNAAELRRTDPDVVAEIDRLLDHHTHAEIAGILNDQGRTSGERRPFRALIIRNIRDTYKLRPREDRLRDQGLIPLPAMAALLGASTSTVKSWYHSGLVGGQRYNDKGEVLYQPPGPNPPTPHRGRRLTSR
jgi:Recombinase zinc beta ribbon domain